MPAHSPRTIADWIDWKALWDELDLSSVSRAQFRQLRQELTRGLRHWDDLIWKAKEGVKPVEFDYGRFGALSRELLPLLNEIARKLADHDDDDSEELRETLRVSVRFDSIPTRAAGEQQHDADEPESEAVAEQDLFLDWWAITSETLKHAIVAANHMAEMQKLSKGRRRRGRAARPFDSLFIQRTLRACQRVGVSTVPTRSDTQPVVHILRAVLCRREPDGRRVADPRKTAEIDLRCA